MATRVGSTGAPRVASPARAGAVEEERVARGSATHAWLPIIYGCDKIKALMKERHSVYDDVTTLIHEIKSG